MFNKLLSFGLVGVLSLGVVSTSVFADANDGGKELVNDVEITIDSGGLLFDTPEIKNFKNTEIDGDSKVIGTSFEGNVKVEDYRGTHEGWNIKASATAFERDTDDKYELPSGSLTLGQIDTVESDNTAGDKPETVQKDRVIIDSEDEVLVVNAKEDEGMGHHEFEFEEDALELTLESRTAKVGNYNSNLTWTLEASPANN